MALAAIAALTAVACSGGGSDSATPSTGQPGLTSATPDGSATTLPPGSGPSTTPSGPSTTATTTATTSTTAAAAAAADRYHRFGTQRTVTTGLLAGTSPDGSALYVERVDAQLSQPGCEGFPEPVLFRVPLAGGSPEAIRAGSNPVRGSIIRGPGGRVALVDLCEGFLSTLHVGTESADGRITGLRALPVNSENSLAGFSWAPDGSALVAGVTEFPGGVGRVVSINLDTGTITPLFTVAGLTFVTEVARLSATVYAVAGEGQVSLREGNGGLLSSVPGFGFALAPDRSRVAAYGERVILLSPGQAGPVPLVTSPGGSVFDAAFSPDNRAVAYTVDTAGTDEVRIVTIADGRSSAVPGVSGLAVRPQFTGDGRALVLNVLADGAAEPPVVLVPLGG